MAAAESRSPYRSRTAALFSALGLITLVLLVLNVVFMRVLTKIKV
jgi:hypothetical protein